MEYCYNSLCGEEDSLYPLALHLSLFVHLYLLFFATWPSAARYVPEHSLLADHVVVAGWNACEETVTSQKPTSRAQAAISPAGRSLPPFAGLGLSSPLGGCFSSVTSSVRCPIWSGYIRIACTSFWLYFLPDTYSL